VNGGKDQWAGDSGRAGIWAQAGLNPTLGERQEVSGCQATWQILSLCPSSHIYKATLRDVLPPYWVVQLRMGLGTSLDWSFSKE
jgi:hypothetical protein